MACAYGIQIISALATQVDIFFCNLLVFLILLIPPTPSQVRSIYNDGLCNIRHRQVCGLARQGRRGGCDDPGLGAGERLDQPAAAVMATTEISSYKSRMGQQCTETVFCRRRQLFGQGRRDGKDDSLQSSLLISFIPRYGGFARHTLTTQIAVQWPPVPGQRLLAVRREANAAAKVCRRGQESPEP